MRKPGFVETPVNTVHQKLLSFAESREKGPLNASRRRRIVTAAVVSVEMIVVGVVLSMAFHVAWLWIPVVAVWLPLMWGLAFAPRATIRWVAWSFAVVPIVGIVALLIYFIASMAAA